MCHHYTYEEEPKALDEFNTEESELFETDEPETDVELLTDGGDGEEDEA